MSRLPIPGSDDNTWGVILNDFLSQSFNPDGTIKDGALSEAKVTGLSADLSMRLQAAKNLSDLSDAGTARQNLQTPSLSPVAAVAVANITLSGTQTVDGRSLAVGDQVLCTAQTTAAQNGTWVVKSGAWVRPTDFQSGISVNGRIVEIQGGNAYANTIWSLTAASGVTIDSSNQNWLLVTSNYRGNWMSSTIYSVNDVVQYQGASWRCRATHLSSLPFTGGVNSANWQQLSQRLTEYDVRDYGALMNNSDDTAAYQAAIDACSSAGGGIVTVPAGQGAAIQIVLKERVWFMGSGMYGTTIRQISNSNKPLFINYISTNGTEANAEFCGLMNLRIDGNRAGTSHTNGSGNTSSNSHGIFFTSNPLYTQATSDSTFDTHQLVENVYVIHCAGQGYIATGRSETRLINLYVEDCLCGGINPSFDTFLQSCSSGNNALFNFSFTHGSIVANNCKAFIAGKNNATNAPGFYISDMGGGIALTGCNAQNNNAQGFLIQNSASVILQGCVADSNNYGVGNAADAYAGVELNNSGNCIIDFLSQQGYQAGNLIGNQGSALRVINGSNNNDIRLTTYAQTGYTLGPAVTTDSVMLSNKIVANGAILNPLPTLAKDADVALTAPSDGQALIYNSSTNKWVNSSAPVGAFVAGILGSGTDGAAILNGTNIVAWASLAGNVYTMSKDCNLTSLIINSGVTLITTGFRVFCQGSVTNNGTIANNGAPATNATGAIAATSRSLGSGRAGGNGNTGAGTVGATGGFAVGNGGAGGNGTGANTGGATVSPTSGFVYTVQNPEVFLTGCIGYAATVFALSGGSGGSGGGGDGTNKGGGGGAGGGIVFVASRAIINNGVVTAIGGNGFTPTVGNCGGGGGGGGGLIAFFSINAYTGSGTTNVGAGSAGLGVGTGTNGSAGTAGQVVTVTLQ